MFVVFCPTFWDIWEHPSWLLASPLQLGCLVEYIYIYFMCDSSFWISQVSKGSSNHTRHLCSAELSPFTTNIIPWEADGLWTALKGEAWSLSKQHVDEHCSFSLFRDSVTYTGVMHAHQREVVYFGPSERIQMWNSLVSVGSGGRSPFMKL